MLSATAPCSESPRSGGSHGRRYRRRPPLGPAQADAHSRQAYLDQILPGAPEGDRHAAVLRGDPRPAVDRRRNRNAAQADDLAAHCRQEARDRADLAGRRDVRGRHAGSRSGCPRRPYRALSRTGNAGRHRIFLQGAVRPAGAAGDRRCAGDRHREYRGSGGRPSEGARRQGHPVRFHAGVGAGRGEIARPASRRAAVDGGHRR